MDLLYPPVEDGSFECGDCRMKFELDIEREFTICLHDLCSQSNDHLIVRKNISQDPNFPILRVASIEGIEWRRSVTDWMRLAPNSSNSCGLNLMDCEVKERKVDHHELRDLEFVEISLHFDSLIQIALGTARIDDEMCYYANEGCRGHTALSKACRQIEYCLASNYVD
jgi:hypothetical protein